MHGSVHMCQNRLTFLLCSLSNTDDEKTHREGGGGQLFSLSAGVGSLTSNRSLNNGGFVSSGVSTHTHAYTPNTVIFSCSLQVRKFWQKGCVPFTVPRYNGFVSNCARDSQLPVFSCLFSLRLTFCGILFSPVAVERYSIFLLCKGHTHKHIQKEKEVESGGSEQGRREEERQSVLFCRQDYIVSPMLDFRHYVKYFQACDSRPVLVPANITPCSTAQQQ